MTVTLGVWLIPTVITIVMWAFAVYQDRKDPFLGQLWSYAAAGATVNVWVFYGLLWLIV
jgi:hypothetical protein